VVVAGSEVLSKEVKRGKRQYSDSDKALALATLDANGGDVRKTAKTLKMPESTLSDWSKNRGVNKEVTEIREVKKKELSEKLEEVAYKLTDNLMIRAESELSILVPMKDVATSLGIVVDKMQLLKGKPTSINKNLTDEERAERAAEIIERGRGRLRAVK
jgi:transposase-like protein